MVVVSGVEVTGAVAELAVAAVEVAETGGGGRAGGGQGGRPQRAVLWIQDEMGQYKPIPVRTGLSDGTRTEVMGEGLMEGMEIVVSDLSQVTTTTPRPATEQSSVRCAGYRRW